MARVQIWFWNSSATRIPPSSPAVICGPSARVLRADDRRPVAAHARRVDGEAPFCLLETFLVWEKRSGVELLRILLTLPQHNSIVVPTPPSPALPILYASTRVSLSATSSQTDLIAPSAATIPTSGDAVCIHAAVFAHQAIGVQFSIQIQSQKTNNKNKSIKYKVIRKVISEWVGGRVWALKNNDSYAPTLERIPNTVTRHNSQLNHPYIHDDIFPMSTASALQK